MNERKGKFNLKIEQSYMKLSHKLLRSYNSENSILEYQSMCLYCRGISIYPLICKFCGYSYCESCLKIIPENMIHCYCKNNLKNNFEHQINSDLKKSSYFIQNQFDSNKINQINYLEVLSNKNVDNFCFVPSEYCELSTNTLKKNNQEYVKISNKISDHTREYNHKFSIKDARMINFNFMKGYSFILNKKILCENDANLLQIVFIKQIDFNSCILNSDFSLNFAKGIVKNRNKFRSLIVIDTFKKSNLKPYLIIFNALSVCSKLKILEIWINSLKLKPILISKYFYNFLSSFIHLNKLSIRGFTFHELMNFKPFESLISLQSLVLWECIFQVNSCEHFFKNNFPNLYKLSLHFNKIYPNITENSQMILNSEKSKINNSLNLNFPSILEIMLTNDSNSLENLFIQILIHKKSLNLRTLNIFFRSYFIPVVIFDFIEFLKSSKIQFLSLGNLIETEGFDSSEFMEFLRNIDCLEYLELTSSLYYENRHWNFVLQGLSFNRSIRVLYIYGLDLSNFYSDLVSFIKINQNIQILCLTNCGLIIDFSIIEAVQKNRTLQYLDVSKNKIEDEFIEEILQSSLTGINIEDTGINLLLKEKIYKRIPKVEFSRDLFKCKEILKHD